MTNAGPESPCQPFSTGYLKIVWSFPTQAKGIGNSSVFWGPENTLISQGDTFLTISTSWVWHLTLLHAHELNDHSAARQACQIRQAW